MKKYFLLIVSLLLINQVTILAQEVTVSAVYSYGSYDKFLNNFGYELGYNQYLNARNRIGFAVSQSFHYAGYSYDFMSDADGKDYYREVKGENRRLTFSIGYGFDILNNTRSGLYIGPKLGLNYYKVNETGTQRLSGESAEHEYKADYRNNNRLGVGLLLEYDRKIFSDNIYLFFSTEPEVVFYSNFGLMGSSDPAMVGFINVNLGLKINLKTQKGTE